MAEENIDNTVNGTGLFNTKIPGLSDAADIQAALRLYHYGTYTYDGANTDPSILPVPSMAKHLQSLVDADAAEVVNRNAAISTHNSDTTDVHGIENTANLATTQYVDTAVTNAINGAVDGYAGLAGTGLDWNSVDSRFDVEPRIANQNTVITKTNSFILDVEDVSKTILLNTSSTMNLTIPLNSSVAIPIGYKYNVIEIGSGVTTFVPASGVTVNSKNSQLFIDTQYGQVTLLKIDTDSWIAYGDIYEGASTPTPVTPVPVHVDPVAPTPTTPTPVTPVPVHVDPVAPTPVTPVTPVAPVTPTAPVTPVGPTPVAPVTVTCNGAPESYTATFPTCNGEDTYEGIFQGTRKLCSDGSYEIITEAAPGTGTFIGFGNCIATNVSACGGSGGAGSPCGTPTPVAPVASTTYYACCSNGASVSGSYADSSAAVSGLNSECDANEPGIGNSVVGGVYTTPQNCGTTPTPVAPVAPTPVAPTPVAPTPVAPTPVAPVALDCSDASGLNATDCAACGYTYTGGQCYDTPAPVAPTPVAPTPVAPTPVQDCTPVYSYTEYRAACGGPVAIYVNPCTGAESYNCPSPTPVAPTPVAPTPVAPTPVAPTPVAPTPVAPTPVAPTPVAPTPVAPTPVAPTPVAPTPVAPTPVAPTPVAPTPVVEAPFFPYFTVPGAV